VDFPHIFMEAIVPERNLMEQWGTLREQAGRGKPALLEAGRGKHSPPASSERVTRESREAKE